MGNKIMGLYDKILIKGVIDDTDDYCGGFGHGWLSLCALSKTWGRTPTGMAAKLARKLD